MSKRRSEIDMKLLMFAIQRTTSFEQLLSSRFIGKTIQKPVDVTFKLNSLYVRIKQNFIFKLDDENWKPFNGIISQCFESHFDTYIGHTETYET